MTGTKQYDCMDPADLSADLNEIGITAGGFAALGGYNSARVKKWLKGDEDIPPHVPVLVRLLKIPGALSVAREVADFYRIAR